MPGAVVKVRAAFDEEADVWFVENCDLHGVNAEGPTLDALVEKLPAIILDLLDEGDAAADHDIALEIVAHRRSTVRARRAA